MNENKHSQEHVISMKTNAIVNETKRMQEQKINEIRSLSEIENQYGTCCGNTTDRRLLEFGAKCSVLFSILCFSFMMVSRDDKNSQVYINIILVIMSIWIPSPGIDKKPKST